MYFHVIGRTYQVLWQTAQHGFKTPPNFGVGTGAFPSEITIEPIGTTEHEKHTRDALPVMKLDPGFQLLSQTSR